MMVSRKKVQSQVKTFNVCILEPSPAFLMRQETLLSPSLYVQDFENVIKKKKKSGALKLNLLTHHFTLYIWVQCPSMGSTAAIFLFKRLFLICSRLSYSPTAIKV